MTFNEARFAQLQRSLDRALTQEWPQLEAVKRRLAVLNPIALSPSTRANEMPVIGTVATDGGENRLNLDPIRIDIFRVADSLGQIHFEEFIAQSPESRQVLQEFTDQNPTLKKVLRYLELGWEELLPETEYQRGNLLSMLRELLEWSALLKLAGRGPSRLLIRDGLLRSVVLKEKVFAAIRDRFEELTLKHGHLLVGVAKRSQVLNYLSVALNLNESFRSAEAGWLRIPADLEREAAPSQYRWIGNRAMGVLQIARLDRGANVPLLPVDIAVWQQERIEEVMALLLQSARGSFPLRGYPLPLSQAHEHARLGSMEIEMLENMLLERITLRAPEMAARVRTLRLLGRELIEERNERTATL